MHRNQAVELLRIVAALGIVWFHAKAPGAQFAHAGLTVFVVLALYFEAARASHHRISSLAMKLLVPWAFFMVVFGAKDLAMGRSLLEGENIVLGVLYGTAPHLWFLPFILAVLVALIGVDCVLPRKGVAIGAALGALGMVVTQHLWQPWSVTIGHPVVEYAYVLGPAFFGVALARAKEGGMLVIAPLVFACMGLVSNGQWVPLIGCLAVTAAVFIPSRLSINVEWLSSAMFGVYLVHPLALSLLKPIREVGWLVPAVLLAFLISVLAVVAYRMLLRKFNAGVAAKA